MWRTRPQRVPSVRVRVPTLIIWGLRDHVLGAEMIDPGLALCDDGRALRIAEATHWAGQVNRLLLDFLGGRAA